MTCLSWWSNDSWEENDNVSMQWRMEIEIGTNAASRSPQTYGELTKEVGASKHVMKDSTTNKDIS